MIHFDYITKENIKEKDSTLAKNSWSFRLNINNWRFWIWKSKRIT